MKALIYLLIFLSFEMPFANGQVVMNDVSTADGFMRVGNIEQAISYYSNALIYNPNDTEALIKRAKAYNLLGRTEESAKDLELADKLNPYLGVYLKPTFRSEFLKTKKYDYKSDNKQPFNKSVVSQNEYRKIIAGEGYSFEIDTLLEFALISVLNEDFDDAEYYLNLAEKDHQNSALYFDLKGLVYLKKEDFENAISSFKNAIRLSPELVPAHHNLAIAYKKSGDLESSRIAFEEALTKNASIANIHFGKANLLSLLNAKSKAREQYKKAIELDENYYEAKANYSVILKTSGEYTLALKEINDVISNNPDAIENYYIRGGIYFIYGEYDKAIEDYNEYLLQFKDDYDSLFNRGVSKILANYVQSGCLDIENAIDNGYDEENKDIYLVYCK